MAHSNSSKIVVIVGPTASGKSDLGIKLARKLDGEIISADSRQVYRGMDIGTGKVRRDRALPVPLSKNKNKKSKLSEDFYSERIRHHLINVVSPKKVFTASDFKTLGERAIEEIVSRNKIPIIVGGTGFYIDILLGRMSVAEVPANSKLRAKLGKQSAEQLFKRLSRRHPRRAETIDKHNKHRLTRAIEIVMTTGKPVPKPELSIKYQVLWMGIRPKDLDGRIKKRLDSRLKQEMIKEVTRLHKEGVSWKRLDDFGLEYRWVARYIKNKKSKITISEKPFKKSEEYQRLLSEIIKYSKRQMAWFKRNKEIHWIKNIKTTERLARRFITD